MADYVIVTPRSLSQAGHPYLQRLREEGYELRFPAPGRQPTEEELLGVVGGAVAYLAGLEKINANILEKAHKLKQGLYSMKRNAILINIARAELIDQEAVHEALDEGRLFGLGTDVFSAEPPEPSPLIRHHRVVSTAHIGAFTEESVNRATVAAVDNIMKYLKKN